MANEAHMTTPPAIENENIGPIIQITDDAANSVEGLPKDPNMDIKSLIRETLPL